MAYQKMDRLSDHPPLRAHIVSFLSILSSHWRQVSSSLTKLIFPWNSTDCVDMTLAAHDETDIKQFVFQSGHDVVTESDLHRWITILVQHNICRLRLYLSTSKSTSLPCFLFTCSTLTDLDLVKIKLPGFPSLITFPKLTRLRFGRVEFGNAARDITSLSFSATSFPVLGSLDLSTTQQIQSISISTPTLERLYLHTRNSPALKLSISTNQQLQLFYEANSLDLSTIDISSETCSSITSAILNMDWHPRLPDASSTSHSASKIMSGMCYTEELVLLESFIEGKKKLELLMFGAKKDHLNMAKFLTRCFPQLQALKIRVQDILHSLKRLPVTGVLVEDNNFKSRDLRKIEISNLIGTEDELELARYFLATATMLEELNISFSS